MSAVFACVVILVCVVGPGAVFCAIFHPQVFTREWWRPKDIALDLGRLTYKVYIVTVTVVTISVVLASIYGIVWVLHAFWRAT